MNFRLPPIYPITDVAISGLTHLEQVKELIAGGARFIQLREKNAAPREFYYSARDVMGFARRFNAKIIINDRVDIALAIGADGVHLGQDDLPPNKAREILGDDAIIGFSTHSLEQARTALGLAVDYIAVGPIFPTASKAKPDPVVGLEKLGAIREVVGAFPLAAIGGIGRENIRHVLDAGADSAAVLSLLFSGGGGIESTMRDLNNEVNNVVSD